MNLSPGYPQWENGYRDRYQKKVLRKRFLKLGIILLVIVSVGCWTMRWLIGLF